METARGVLVVEVTESCPEGPEYWAALRVISEVGLKLQAELDRTGGPGGRTVGPLDRVGELTQGQWRWRLELAVPERGFEIARHLAGSGPLRFDRRT